MQQNIYRKNINAQVHFKQFLIQRCIQSKERYYVNISEASIDLNAVIFKWLIKLILKRKVIRDCQIFFLTNNVTFQRLFRWSKIHKKNQNSEVFHQLLSFGSLIGCPFLLSQELFHPKDTIKVQATSKWLIGFSDRYRKFLWDLSH